MAEAVVKPDFTLSQVISQLWQGKEIWSGPTIGYAFASSLTAYLNSGLAGSFAALDNVQRAGVNAALAEWASVASLNLVERPVAQAELSFYLDLTGDLIGKKSLGGAFYPAANAAQDPAGDVGFSALLFTEPVYQPFIFSTMLHEIGHALGLSHPGPYNGCGFTYADAAAYLQDSAQYSIMSYFDAASTGADHVDANGVTWQALTPLLHDIASIQWLYGVNLATRAGDTVYGFHSSAGSSAYDFAALARPPVVCIWDGGGLDTLNLSGYASDSRIDLNEGAFSDAGGLTRNISIAYGALIENAIGGSGNDRLAGNLLPNILVGGAGNDSIDGGAGFDSAVYSGPRARYRISSSEAGLTVTDTLGIDGSDHLLNIEQLIFADCILNLAELSALPLISFRPLTVQEGAAGSQHTVLVEVLLSRYTNQAVSFSYATTPGTATEGKDYLAASGSITLAAGQSSALIPITVLGDALADPDESFGLRLDQVIGAIAPAFDPALVKIADEDVSAIDDIGATKETARLLAVGTSGQGAINTIGDSDWFKVRFTHDGTYTVRLSGLATGGGTLPFSTLTVYDAFGTRMISKSGGTLTQDTSGDTVLTIAGLDDGDYYLAVASQELAGSNAARTGSYSLGITPAAGDDIGSTPLTAYVLGQTDGYENIAFQHGRIDSAGDSDWFRVRLTAGHNYEFYVFGAASNAGTLGASALAIYDSVGAPVLPLTTGGYGLDARISFTAPASGTFYVAASAASGKFDTTGSYLFWQHGLDPAPRDQIVLQRPTGEVIAVDATRGAQGIYSLVDLEVGEKAVAAGHVSVSPYGGLIVQKAEGSFMSWSSGEGIVADWAGGGGWAALPELKGLQILGADAFITTAAAPNFLNSAMVVAKGADGLVLQALGGGLLHGFGDTGFGAGTVSSPKATLPANAEFAGFIYSQGAAHTAGQADRARPFEYADLLLRDPSSGTLSIWNFAGHQDYALARDWSIAGIGNLSGTAADDLLVYSASEQRYSVFSFAAGFSSFGMTTANREILGVANLDGLGFDDILYRDTTNGHLGYWDGAAVHDLGALLGAGVQLVGFMEGRALAS